jgi:hypothetical protein
MPETTVDESTFGLEVGVSGFKEIWEAATLTQVCIFDIGQVFSFGNESCI